MSAILSRRQCVKKIDRVTTGRIVLWSNEIAGSHNALGCFHDDVIK